MQDESRRVDAFEQRILDEFERIRMRRPGYEADDLVSARRIAEWVCASLLAGPDLDSEPLGLARLAQRVREKQPEREELRGWLEALARECNPSSHGSTRSAEDHRRAWQHTRPLLRSIVGWYYGSVLGRPPPSVVHESLAKSDLVTLPSWRTHLAANLTVLVLAVGALVGWNVFSTEREIPGRAAAATSALLPEPSDSPEADGSRMSDARALVRPERSDVAELPAVCPADMVRVPAEVAEGGMDVCIDRTEVSLAAYRTCPEFVCPSERTPFWQAADLAELTRQGPFCTVARVDCHGRSCAPCEGDCTAHPINCVSHTSAAAYCAHLGRRLPTDAEWERSARGPDRRTFPWGSGTPTAAVVNLCGEDCVAFARLRGLRGSTWVAAPGHEDDGYLLTAPVFAFRDGASAAGAVQLAGNVAEWVDGPEGPRVRGGGFLRFKTLEGRAWVRADASVPTPASHRYLQVGFRCACTLGQCGGV